MLVAHWRILCRQSVHSVIEWGETASEVVSRRGRESQSGERQYVRSWFRSRHGFVRTNWPSVTH